LAIQEQLQFAMPTRKREAKQNSGKKIADYYYNHKGRIPPYLPDGRDPKAVMQAFDDCVTMINRTLKELEDELKTKLDSPKQIKSTIHKTKDLEENLRDTYETLFDVYCHALMVTGSFKCNWDELRRLPKMYQAIEGFMANRT
jgi:hypothetical protein